MNKPNIECHLWMAPKCKCTWQITSDGTVRFVASSLTNNGYFFLIFIFINNFGKEISIFTSPAELKGVKINLTRFHGHCHRIKGQFEIQCQYWFIMFFRLFSLWKGYLISEYKSLSQFKKGKCFRQSGSGGQGIPTYLVWLTNF